MTNGDGIAGFGGDAKLMIVKAGTGDGSFTDVDEASAIAYAVDHGARIVNLSLGGTSTSTVEASAVDYAAAHGVLVVAAAGNDFAGGNPTMYPAALVQPLGSNGLGGKGLAVGATDATGERAAFSSTGTYVSLAAPGDRVFSAVSSTSPEALFPRVALPGSLGGFYGYGSGTSFAAPQVAGAAALVMAANPRLDAEAVAAILKETASGRGDWSPELGYGVIDVAAAVERAATVRAPAARSSLSLGARTVGPAAQPHGDPFVDRSRDLALVAAGRRRRSAQRLVDTCRDGADECDGQGGPSAEAHTRRPPPASGALAGSRRSGAGDERSRHRHAAASGRSAASPLERGLCCRP